MSCEAVRRVYFVMEVHPKYTRSASEAWWIAKMWAENLQMGGEKLYLCKLNGNCGLQRLRLRNYESVISESGEDLSALQTRFLCIVNKA